VHYSPVNIIKAIFDHWHLNEKLFILVENRYRLIYPMDIYFFFVGIMHFIVPPGLPAMMSWMYDLSATLHMISSIAEILGGLGMILPGLFRIQTRLVPLAAAGLVLVMIGAMIYHIARGETFNLVNNLFLAVLLAFVAYGRWKLKPIPERGEATAT
jgi:uncharacterized membrane protein